MKTEDKIRNVNVVTTGDFISFEFIQDGVWRRARISGTALRKLGAGKDIPRDDVFSSNQDRVALIACVVGRRAPPEQEVVLSSDDF